MEYSKRYRIEKTTYSRNNPRRRVTSLVTGRSYTVESTRNNPRGWTCDCKTFWDNIRVGADNPSCWHIKVCMQKGGQDLSRSPESTLPVAEDVPYSALSCPKCGATDRTKAGKKSDKQVYRCKSCRCRYVHTEPGFERNKHSPEIIAGCLNMLMSGMSYRKIQEHVRCYFGVKLSHSTILYWAKKYTILIKKYIDTIRPVTGNVWSMDEAYVNVKRSKPIGKYGPGNWLWTAIDPKTRIVLATQISADTRSGKDVTRILDTIKSMFGDPDFVVTDSLSSYPTPIKKKMPDTVHLRTKSIREGFTNMSIERYHNEIREKLKTCRGLGNAGSAQVLCDLLRIHHNYVRPHMGLGGRTPAEAAGVVTAKAARGKYGSLIRMAAVKNRQIAGKLGPLNEKAEISVDEDCTKIVPKDWLENDEWRQLNEIVTGLGFIWMFSAYARYWVRFENAVPQVHTKPLPKARSRGVT